MTYSSDRWVTSSGDDRHRRGLYTFWRRTAPYPTFQLFDAPSRELACTRRPRSNTPLQALAVLNDPVFFEAAGGLAHRMLELEGRGDVERIAHGFVRCTSRRPTASETTTRRRCRRSMRRWRVAAFCEVGRPMVRAPLGCLRRLQQATCQH